MNCEKSSFSLTWKISSKIFLIYIFMWIHRLGLEFPKWYVCSKWEIFKNNDSPYLRRIRTWVTCFWVNILFSIYPSLSLCLWDRFRSTGYVGVVHQMGLKSNQEIMYVAWIGLFGIRGHVGERNEIGFKEEMFIAPESFVSFFKWLFV